MSGKRRANVMSEYVDESSSDEQADDFDCEVSSSGRFGPGRQEQHSSVTSNASSSETRRRGRGVSKRPCLNRNAQMARENRQRKKEYLEKVENKLSFYRQENKNLSIRIQRQAIDLKRLSAEVSYLKNVLNNSSSITTLLKSMNDTLSGKNIIKRDNRSFENNPRARKDSENSSSSDEKTVLKNDTGATWRRAGELYSDRSAATIRYEIPAGNLKDRSIGDSDHTYTTSRDGSDYGKPTCYTEIDATDSDKDDSGGLREMAADRFINDLTTSSLNLGIPGDELPQFDPNLFDSIAKETDSMEYFHNNCLDDGNLFESLENSGICLHVNSGKISLEFCSICHLNSINSNE